jgi:hypothetical protein
LATSDHLKTPVLDDFKNGGTSEEDAKKKARILQILQELDNMDETEFTLDNTRRKNDDGGCHHSNRSAAFDSNDDSDSGLALAASLGPPEEDRVCSLAEEWSSSTGSERITGSPVSIDRSSGSSCSSSSNSGIRGPKGRSRVPEAVDSEEEVIVICGDNGTIRSNNSFGLEGTSNAVAFETHL